MSHWGWGLSSAAGLSAARAMPAARAAAARLPLAGSVAGAADWINGQSTSSPLPLPAAAAAAAHKVDTLLAAAKSSSGGGVPPGSGQSPANTPMRTATPSTPVVSTVIPSPTALCPSNTLGARLLAMGGTCETSTKHVSPGAASARARGNSARAPPAAAMLVLGSPTSAFTGSPSATATALDLSPQLSAAIVTWGTGTPATSATSARSERPVATPPGEAPLPTMSAGSQGAGRTSAVSTTRAPGDSLGSALRAGSGKGDTGSVGDTGLLPLSDNESVADGEGEREPVALGLSVTELERELVGLDEGV